LRQFLPDESVLLVENDGLLCFLVQTLDLVLDYFEELDGLVERFDV
jgi:hypothetical protein